MFDLCLRCPHRRSLWRAKVGRTLLLLVRRLGADDVTARRDEARKNRPFGDDATSAGNRSPSSQRTPQPRHGATLDQTLLAGACSRTIRASGFDVASLGRRRTSTVNEGAARLNVVLDTAHRSADSSRRRRPCEAKRNKAIGGHCGQNGGPPDIRETDFRGAEREFHPGFQEGPSDPQGVPVLMRDPGQRLGERGRASTGPVRLKIAGRCSRIGTPRISSESSKACARRAA